MIVLDTNVVSELMRPSPDDRVTAWLRARAAQDTYLTSISAGELWYGVELLPTGQRRSRLEVQLRAMLSEDFAGRLLDFDGAAAEAFGRLHAAQRKRGKLPGTADAQIAAIALVYKFAVATRDASGFAHSGLKIFNPWTD